MMREVEPGKTWFIYSGNLRIGMVRKFDITPFSWFGLRKVEKKFKFYLHFFWKLDDSGNNPGQAFDTLDEARIKARNYLQECTTMFMDDYSTWNDAHCF